VLTPPDGLPEAVLVPALGRWWGVAVASIEYRPVGWGSHHWEVTDTAGRRWFVTVDELEDKRLSASEPLAAGFGRLRASLAAARDLRACGRTFVVAPLPAGDGEPLALVSDRFGVALYPFIDGQSFEWDEFSSSAHRLGVLSLLIAVHTAPAAASRHALADDFGVPLRDELEAACAVGGGADDGGADDAGADDGGAAYGGAAHGGPYARPAALLIRQNAAAIQRQLARYDHLVTQARAAGTQAVLTHGEPHPGNTMLTGDGWLLIDWDTALVAPPERDLWSLDPGDGTILDAYASATGVSPRPALLDFYRLRWDIADIAAGVSRFRRPHAGSIDDAKTWELLCSLIDHIATASP
jgi:hypothetical protein